MLVFVTPGSPAAVNGWTAIGPSGGAATKVLYSAMPNTAFLIAWGGFYRSQDAGVSWQLIKADFPSLPLDMALDAADPLRVYVVGPATPALFMSTDGGATLAPVTTVPVAVSQATNVVVSGDGSTICVANGAELYCSVDRGQTWQASNPVSTYAHSSLTQLIMDPTDPKTLYATAIVSATGSGIVATHDLGNTWLLLPPTGVSPVGVYGLAVNPAKNTELWAAQTDGVWVSADSGMHWSRTFTTGAASIAMDPVRPEILYAGDYYGHVFRTADAGVLWTDVTGNSSAGEVFSLSIDASQDSHVLAGGTSGVAGTGTSGTAWTPQNTGFMGTAIDSLVPDPTADRIYIGVPTGGVFLTANGLGTVVPANNTALAQLGTTGTIVSTGPLLAQAGVLSVVQSSGIARSTDGGTSWSLLPFAPPGGNPLVAIASAAAAPQILIAGSTSAIYRSSDGGVTWTHITAGLPANAGVGAKQLFAAASDPNLFYGFLSSPPPQGSTTLPTILGVYRSVDAGLTWTAANAAPASGPDTLLAVDPANADVLYGPTVLNHSALSIELLKSIDGGASWTTLSWPYNQWDQEALALTVDPVHPQILFAASIDGIGRSVDAGTTWEIFRDPIQHPYWNTRTLVVDPKRPETLYAGSAASGVQTFTVAPDLALTVVAPVNPMPVGVPSSFAYTVSNNGPFDATGVTVTLQLPSTAQHVTASATGATCTVVAGAVNCKFPVLRTGTNATATLTVTAATAGSFSVLGRVAGDQPDPDSTNNALSSVATVALIADVSVAVTGTTLAQVGDAVTYLLSVSNAGPDAAAAVQLTFQMPAGLAVRTVASLGGTCGVAGGLVTCSIDTLAAASTVNATVNATAAVAGTQTATASVATGATDLVGANNSAIVTTSVSAAAPPPPAVTAASTAKGGGSLSVWELLALAVCLIAQWVRRHEPASR